MTAEQKFRKCPGMRELAGEYRESAELLRVRIGELEESYKGMDPYTAEGRSMRKRILTLKGMFSDTALLASFLEDYRPNPGRLSGFLEVREEIPRGFPPRSERKYRYWEGRDV